MVIAEKDLKSVSLVLFLLLALVGCSRSTNVAMRMVIPPGASVLEVSDGGVFLMASPLSQEMPVFPSGVSLASSVSVCVEFVIAESGEVGSARPIYGLQECPLSQSETDQRFVDASVAAVRRWLFLAAAICHFPPETPKNEDCSGPGVKEIPVPIRLSYVFLFDSGGRVTAKSGNR